MKGFCRICGSDLQGNQRRWIFHTSGKRRLQIVLSYVLGYIISRDGQGEFLCSKCAFMLEEVLKYDIVIARVKTVASERLQMLTAEKEQLIQCIVHLYFQYNEKAKISPYREYKSTQCVNQCSSQYRTLLQDESFLSEFWMPEISSKKNLHCSKCWRAFSGGHRKRTCLCSESVRVADLFCTLVCSTPKRTRRSVLTGSLHQSLLSSPSQSMCFNLDQKKSMSTGKLPTRVHSRQLDKLTTLNSTKLDDWITDEESEKVQLKSMFDCIAPIENYPLMRQSIANAIWEIKHIGYKPVPPLSKSKIPKRVKFSARRIESGCNITTALQETYNLNDGKFFQEMWKSLGDDYGSFKPENMVEKQRQLGQLEMEAKQLKADLENAEATICALQEKLKKADDAKKILKENVNDKENELVAEKQNSLKRDKTIQGLTLALKAKDKEIDELCHEIEDRDSALVKARDSIHKAQLQKFQGAEEYQSLMTEKETELAELRADRNAKAMEIQKLQRTSNRKEQELNDLTEAKAQLEEEVEALQLQKAKDDKMVNDIQNHIQKLGAELTEKERAMEHKYQSLLIENKQKLQSQELVIERLTDSLNNKDRLLQVWTRKEFTVEN